MQQHPVGSSEDSDWLITNYNCCPREFVFHNVKVESEFSIQTTTKHISNRQQLSNYLLTSQNFLKIQQDEREVA